MSHALLSPSSASRWLTCTPSARLETKFPDAAGEAAKEGTLAHELSELLIMYKLHNIQYPFHNTKMAKIQGNPLYSVSMHAYCQEYADYVAERFNAAKARDNCAQIDLETRLDMSEFVPGGFGTGDVTIASDYMFEFIDLKYGKGVQVYAINNKQMLLYALGLLKKYGFIYNVKVIRMTIYQPRLDNISTWEISINDLLLWANQVLKPKALEAYNGSGPFIAGNHCQFCRAKHLCKAFADYNLQIAKDEFPDAIPELLTDEQVAKIIRQSKEFLGWIKAVNSYALSSALKGKKWPGYKLVKGRADRKITDLVAAAKKLEAEPDLKHEQLYKPEVLRGITELELLLTKKRFTTLIGDYVIKPDGAPALVTEDDARPAINSIDAALLSFAEINFADTE